MTSSVRTSVSTNTTYWVKLHLSVNTSHSAISIIFANRVVYSTVILLLLVAPLGKLLYIDLIFNTYNYYIAHKCFYAKFCFCVKLLFCFVNRSNLTRLWITHLQSYLTTLSITALWRARNILKDVIEVMVCIELPVLFCLLKIQAQQLFPK